METHKNTAPQDVLHVTVSDVKTGKLLKDFKTAGLSVVYSNKNGQACFSYVDGLSTVRVVGMAIGLQSLSEEIEKILKEGAGVEYIEELKKCLKEETNETKVVKRELSEKEAPEMTFSENMESKEGE